MPRKVRKFSSIEEAKQWMISNTEGEIIKVVEAPELGIGPLPILSYLRPLGITSMPLPERIAKEIEIWTWRQKGFRILSKYETLQGTLQIEECFVVVPEDFDKEVYEIWIYNIESGRVFPIEADE
jgi:hypothetical protein